MQIKKESCLYSQRAQTRPLIGTVRGACSAALKAFEGLRSLTKVLCNLSSAQYAKLYTGQS